MIKARRASEDAINLLREVGAIRNNKEKITIRYPSQICGTGKCGQRALFNIWGPIMYQEMVCSHPLMDSPLTTDDQLTQLHSYGRNQYKVNGQIYHLRSHHWVSLSDKWYTDDAYRWEVLLPHVAMTALSSMEEVEHTAPSSVYGMRTQESEDIQTASCSMLSRCTICIKKT